MTLIQFVNSNISMGKVLESIDIEPRRSMYCPFHEDVEGGHRSAKFFEDTDSMYCFSERKSYRAYDAMIMLVGHTPASLYQWAVSQGWQPSINVQKHTENTSTFIVPINIIMFWKTGDISLKEFMDLMKEEYEKSISPKF